MTYQKTEQEKIDIQALILDMDGVVWRGPEPIGDLPRIFSEIASIGLEVIFATNNSTLTVDPYQSKLAGLGLKIGEEQVITSAEATADYLLGEFPAGSSVYVIGEKGLEQTLMKYGYSIREEDAVAVIVGLDRDLTYAKLAIGMRLVDNGARLVGTNPDKTLPQPENAIPGAGAMIAALEASTGTEAFVIGKPSPLMFNLALDRLALDPTEALVVGDRLETDIAGGQASGCHTALVLSGASTEAQAQKWQPAPTFITDDLASLIAGIT